MGRNVSSVWVLWVLALCTFGCSKSHSLDRLGGLDPASPAASKPDAGSSTSDGGSAPMPMPRPGGPRPGGGPGGGPGPAPSGPGTDPSVPTEPGGIGGACGDAADCSAAGAECLEFESLGGGGFALEFPGGYCTLNCTPNSGDTECGVGSLCFSPSFGPAPLGPVEDLATCVKACDSDAQCRADEGYACQTIPFVGGPAKFCLPPLDMSGGGPGGGGGGD